MTANPLEFFEAAAAQADRVVAAVRADQLGDPTPCTGWTVRDVINHLTTGNLLFAAIVSDGPKPDRSADHLGDDHLTAFRASVTQLAEVFVKHDVLSGTYATPIGEGPGALLVHMRFNELMVHSWDIAKATGQSTDLDPALAEKALANFQAVSHIPRGEDKLFGESMPVPPHATAADRLAAFTGREVR